MAEIPISKREARAVVTAVVGDTLRVELPENPTTGFRWERVDDDVRLEVVGDEFLPGAEQAPGAAGTRVLRLEAREAGRVALALLLRQAWEPRDPSDRYEVTIDIAE
jgi:inhibitor of cysteine peptidase